MGVAENIQTARRFYAAGPSDADEQREQLLAPEAVWHVPGENPVSGAYKGIEAIANDMSGKMEPLDEWRIEPRHMMGNADLVVAVVHLIGQRRGQSIKTHGAHVFRFDDHGRIVEAWGFAEDQTALDRFFSA
jgi:ketosteroid isomerase-like protein